MKNFTYLLFIVAAAFEIAGCVAATSVDPYQAAADRANAHFQKHNQMTPEQKAAWFEQKVREGKVQMPANFTVMPNGKTVPLPRAKQTPPAIAGDRRLPVHEQTSRDAGATARTYQQGQAEQEEQMIYMEEQRRQQEEQFEQAQQAQRQRDLELGIGYDPTRDYNIGQ